MAKLSLMTQLWNTLWKFPTVLQADFNRRLLSLGCTTIAWEKKKPQLKEMQLLGQYTLHINNLQQNEIQQMNDRSFNARFAGEILLLLDRYLRRSENWAPKYQTSSSIV